jgi:hypothetical protein
LPLTLSWQAPKGCANKAELLAELSRIARARPGRQIPALIALGRIVRAAGGYRLTLRTERDRLVGERTLSAPDCRSLAREATLVLALAFGAGVELVEPTQASSSATPSQVPSETPAISQMERSGEQQAPGAAQDAPAQTPLIAAPPLPDARGASNRESASTGSAPTAARFAIFAGGGAALRSLPAVAGALLLGAELGFEHVQLQPRLYWLPGVAQSLKRGALARYASLGAGLDACAASSWLSVRVALCAGLEIASVRAQAKGTDADSAQRATVSALTLSLPLALPAAARLSLRIAPELQVALSKPSFVIDGLGEVFRPARLRVGLSAALRLSL